MKKSVKSQFCFPLELRLRVVDLLCFLLQPRGGLQTALKGHAGTLRQIHSQQIIPMEQAMVRTPSCALCIIHTMLSSRFNATPAQKNCLENKEKHDFFFFWQTFVHCFSLLVVNNNNLEERKRAKFKVWWLKKKRYRNTTATGPVVLFFLWLNSLLFLGKHPKMLVTYYFPPPDETKENIFWPSIWQAGQTWLSATAHHWFLNGDNLPNCSSLWYFILSLNCHSSCFNRASTLKGPPLLSVNEAGCV